MADEADWLAPDKASRKAIDFIGAGLFHACGGETCARLDRVAVAVAGDRCCSLSALKKAFACRAPCKACGRPYVEWAAQPMGAPRRGRSPCRGVLALACVAPPRRPFVSLAPTRGRRPLPEAGVA